MKMTIQLQYQHQNQSQKKEWEGQPLLVICNMKGNVLKNNNWAVVHYSYSYQFSSKAEQKSWYISMISGADVNGERNECEATSVKVVETNINPDQHSNGLTKKIKAHLTDG